MYMKSIVPHSSSRAWLELRVALGGQGWGSREAAVSALLLGEVGGPGWCGEWVWGVGAGGFGGSSLHASEP